MQALALARAVLAREPANVAATRNAGFAIALRGDNRAAERLFRYAESLSRRDVVTQIWLIEAAVRRNNIREALTHYDRALRTSLNTRATLFPILLAASRDPAIAAPLRDVLARRPHWWREFAFVVAQHGQVAATLASIIGGLSLDPSVEGDRLVLINAIGRLITLGDYDQAYALYRRVRPPPTASHGLIRDGDFTAEYPLPPFEWTFVDEPGLSAVRQPVSEGQSEIALFLIAAEGRSGEVARQFLLLPPGRYRLSARIGDIQGDSLGRPAISLLCATSTQARLTTIRLPNARPSGRPFISDPIMVPSQCRAQWLTIETGNSLARQHGTPWIDGLAMTED